MNLIELYLEDAWTQNQVFTYTHTTLLPRGIRVLVPLQSRLVVGFVKQSYQGTVDFDVREIVEIIDQDPIISDELWNLAHWMSEETLNPIIRCFQAILPNVLRPSSSAKKAKMIRMIRFKEVASDLTTRQTEVLNQVKQRKEMTYTEALSLFKSVLKTLIEKGLIEEFEMEQEHQDTTSKKIDIPYQLTKKQKEIIQQIQLDRSQVYLIHGPTGSGKTEIYLHVAQKVLNQQGQVLILVPEISLTPQMIQRFQDRFGMDIGIYHSGLNNQEKYEQYQRVQASTVNIVVGTRSAIFLPFSNLGLIVVDEEHDDSFKQESTPYYHARDIAKYRGQIHNCPVVLGSASPSLESYARGLKRIYTLLKLPNRRDKHGLEMVVVNTSLGALGSIEKIMDPLLVQAMDDSLRNRQQVILLLNRRSYAPQVYCPTCQTNVMCPHCERTLSYHQVDQSLRCHTCDYALNSLRCPVCHQPTLRFRGIGTQRLQEIVSQTFPQAKVARMDTDTTRVKNAHFNILRRFMNHEIDILIGTQMIAKGLDNFNVTTVGILNADAALMHEDFSSSQRAFNLILQASGRAGRGHLNGKVIVQTFNPDHYALEAAIAQNYTMFFNQEMKYRHLANYPPYTYLIELRFTHSKLEKSLELAYHYRNALIEKMNVMGPSVLSKVRDIEPVRIVLRSKDLITMRQDLKQVDQLLQSERKGVRVIININPQQLTG